MKVIKIIVLVIIGIIFWYLALPALALWYIWKKSKITDKKKKVIYSGIVLLVSFILWGILISSMVDDNKEPKLTISAPTNNQSVQAGSIDIKGSVTPSQAKVTVENGNIDKDVNGNFTGKVLLSNEQNIVSIKAENGDKSDMVSLNITRVFTEEEKAKKQAELEAQKKAEEEKAAKAKAEQDAWDKSKAGQLCKKHSDWSKEDCEKLADNKIWIGMSLDMLKEKRGLPDSANPSNYGSGTDWQWCWHDYSPSCFYDHDEDGLVDSYN